MAVSVSTRRQTVIYFAYALFALCGLLFAFMVFVIAFGPWLAKHTSFVEDVGDCSHADSWW